MSKRASLIGEKNITMRDKLITSTAKISSQIGELINMQEVENRVNELFCDRIKKACTLLEKLDLENQKNELLNTLRS